MKVALHVDGPRIRGNEQQALLLVRGLVMGGTEVVVSCRPGPVLSEMEAAGARTTTARPRGDADIVSALRFAGWLRRERVDALLVTSWKRAVGAAWAARRAGVPRLVLRVGGLRGRGRGAGAQLRRLMVPRWYDLVITNAEMVRADVLREIPDLEPDRVPVVPNAVAFRPQPPAPIRQELGLDADATILLGVGGLEENKGLDQLARAVGALDARTHVVVAGAGPPDRIGRLRAHARDSGAGDRLHLLGHRRDVPALLAAADVFVLPSRADSLPNALLEAMAAGCPAVMTDVGGVREALGARDGRPAAGWVVPRDDLTALVACLRTVVAAVRDGNPEVEERVREARFRAERCYGPALMVERYAALLAAPEGGGR